MIKEIDSTKKELEKDKDKFEQDVIHLLGRTMFITFFYFLLGELLAKNGQRGEKEVRLP